MLFATYDPDCHNYVADFLQENNYRIEILNQDAIKGDTEIIALQGYPPIKKDQGMCTECANP